DLSFTLLLSPVPINLLLQTASNRLPGDDSSALRRLQGLGNGRDRGPDIAQLRRQYHGVVGLGQLAELGHVLLGYPQGHGILDRKSVVQGKTVELGRRRGTQKQLQPTR